MCVCGRPSPRLIKHHQNGHWQHGKDAEKGQYIGNRQHEKLIKIYLMTLTPSRMVIKPFLMLWQLSYDGMQLQPQGQKMSYDLKFHAYDSPLRSHVSATPNMQIKTLKGQVLANHAPGQGLVEFPGSEKANVLFSPAQAKNATAGVESFANQTQLDQYPLDVQI